MSQTISPLQASLAKLTGESDPKTRMNQAQEPSHGGGLSKQHSPMVGQDTSFHPSAQGLRAAAASEKYQQAYGYSQTMNLTLTTKEGDTVQVDFRQLYAQYQSYKHEQAAMEGPKGARYFESREAMEATAFEERFGFSVKGDLNKDELKAIQSVFNQVADLANQFFDGNIEEAFKQAQNMKVDFGQLSNVSLDMQKTEVRTQTYQQAAAYQGVQQASQPVKQDGEGAKVADLPPYLQKMQQVVATMDQYFAQAREKVDQIFSMTLSQRDPEQKPFDAWYNKVKSFHDQLAEMANLDKVTLKPSGVEIPAMTATTEKSQQTAQEPKPSADKVSTEG